MHEQRQRRFVLRTIKMDTEYIVLLKYRIALTS